MSDPQQTLTPRFQQALERAFGPPHGEADPLVRPAQNPRFGDYQANVAMPMGKTLGRPPREVAQALVDHLDVSDLCEDPEIAGPGFINLRFRPEALGREAAALLEDPRLGVRAAPTSQRVVVDYSAPNVAKEMHVGHLRSTIIGDAIARVLEGVGHDVVRQNHIGDWGTQFGMLVEHLLTAGPPGGERASETIADLNQFYQAAKERFDADATFAKRARERVVALQSGDPETVRCWEALVSESKRHFQPIYRRLGVPLTDDHIRGESLYNPLLPEVVEELRERGLLSESEGTLCVFPPGFVGRDGDALPLIVQKSDGGYLYATTDLAALRHRVRQVGAERLVYVADARQNQHFAMVFKTAELAGWLDGVRADHVAFGTILGKDNRPLKTRSGEPPRLWDLLDEAEQRAHRVVEEKNPQLSPGEREAIARRVGIGALKYADLANDRMKDYVFDWDRMLAMDGNTGPYLQYAYARIRSIFRKGGVTSVDPPATLRVEEPWERALVLKLLQLDGVVQSVAERLEPHRLCNHLYDLANTFTSFYENCPVLGAEGETRRSRLALCELTARALSHGLGLLGIETIERM